MSTNLNSQSGAEGPEAKAENGSPAGSPQARNQEKESVMKTKQLCIAGALVAGLLVQGTSPAQTPEGAAPRQTVAVEAAGGESAQAVRGSLRGFLGLAGQADLVFRGVVQGIQYRLSQPDGPEGTRVPYTFVTYRVDEVLRGENPGGQVTLRFIGGLHEETMRYMSASTVPRFDLGDEDILFVTGNGERLCPLVGEQRGRLRIVGGQVYTEDGHAVRLSASGELELGPRYALEEVMTTTVHGPSGSRVFHVGLGPDTLGGASDAVAPELVVECIQGLDLPAETGGLFQSADPAAPFSGPDMTQAAPPVAKAGEEEAPTEPEGTEEIGPQMKIRTR
jgi:hypothetical protein